MWERRGHNVLRKRIPPEYDEVIVCFFYKKYEDDLVNDAFGVFAADGIPSPQLILHNTTSNPTKKL